MLKKFKRRILNWVMGHLFNALTERDAIHFNGKDLIIGGRTLNQNERNNLASEAKVLLHSEIWFLLKREMEIAANRKMYQSSIKDDDIIFGKAMLYNIDLMNKKVERLAKANK